MHCLKQKYQMWMVNLGEICIKTPFKTFQFDDIVQNMFSFCSVAKVGCPISLIFVIHFVFDEPVTECLLCKI